MGAFHRIVRELATEVPTSFMEYLRMDEDHFCFLFFSLLMFCQLMNFPPLQSKPSFYVKLTTGEN